MSQSGRLIRLDYLRTSGIASLARFIPSIRIVLVLVLLSAAYSGEVRAAISIGGAVFRFVTVLRALIIPMKQFGMTGGRFVLSEKGKLGAMHLATVHVRCLALLEACSAVLDGVRACTPAFDQLPWIIVALMGIAAPALLWSVVFATRLLFIALQAGLPRRHSM